MSWIACCHGNMRLMELEKIDYAELNAKQKELYNFQKLSGLLADYGITTIRLSDDWEGADFIAKNAKTGEHILVQLKSRFGLWMKYEGKQFWIAFPDHDNNQWYLYDHDSIMACLRNLEHKLFSTESWIKGNAYTFPTLPSEIRHLLKEV